MRVVSSKHWARCPCVEPLQMFGLRVLFDALRDVYLICVHHPGSIRMLPVVGDQTSHLPPKRPGRTRGYLAITDQGLKPLPRQRLRRRGLSRLDCSSMKLFAVWFRRFRKARIGR